MAKTKQSKEALKTRMPKRTLKLPEVLSAAKSPFLQAISRKVSALWDKVRKFDWHKQLNKAHKIYHKMQPKLQKVKKITLKAVSHWKFLTLFLPSFIFFYYFLGSMMAENIDVTTEYNLAEKHLPMFETADSMSFLLKREVDDKMWTPNLPFIFPASILDNMPNFQEGIVAGVRGIVPVIKHFEQNTDAQKDDIKAAAKLLSYPPNVWLMSRKGKFNLAPSSNAQYRKAAAELHKFAKDGVFLPKAEDLDALLQKISTNLQKITVRNEEQQREKSTDWIDTSSDDLFYFGKGYAFALWQISKTLGADFREIILEKNLYAEWTYLVNSLKKAAEFEPMIVRNGAPDSLFKPNHLIMQNFYLQRAIVAAQKIRNGVLKESHAD